VLQQALQPILLVRSTGQSAPSMVAPARILVPVDGSPLAERALEVAREIAEPRTDIALLRVISAVPSGKRAPSPQGSQPRDEAERYLDWLRQLHLDGAPLRGLIRAGDPIAEIVAAADDEVCDLIVMASHGYTGPSRLFLGSVADGVVRRTGKPVLIISARACAARAASPYGVADVMTRELSVVRDDEPLIGAIRKLLRRRVSGLPVVDASGKLVGMLSEWDLLRWQGEAASHPTRGSAAGPSDYAHRLEQTSVRQVMTRPAVSLEPSEPLSSALSAMLDHKISRIVVVKDERPIGIVTRADVLKVMADRWQAGVPGED
jgi:CBS domain-containing protein